MNKTVSRKQRYFNP